MDWTITSKTSGDGLDNNIKQAGNGPSRRPAQGSQEQSAWNIRGPKTPGEVPYRPKRFFIVKQNLIVPINLKKTLWKSKLFRQ